MGENHMDFYRQLRNKINSWLQGNEGKNHKWAEYLMLVPDMFHLLCKLVMDPDVSPAEKAKLGARRFVVDTVRIANANPCPPIIVGVGVGGNLEKACLLAKKALLRPIDQPHPDRRIAAREAQLLQDINKLGIGPQGMGGDTTALAVTMEVYPTHIASLPVAVSLNCHSARRAVVTV
jgi:tartrate/fumarate subfamily iron-sulfur-dependent hydro-lyase alpha chain